MDTADRVSAGLDLITLGRAGVDFYSQQIGCRLEDATSFAKYVGGSPTNTAIGAARLGLKAGLISRVGDDHMGRFILRTLQEEGVDVRGVCCDPERLTALVILGILDKKTFPLLFYRENCADMALVPQDIDVSWLQSAGALLISGTHLSRPGVYAASEFAARTVKAAGRKLVLDIDYRPVLWGLAPKDQGENRFVPAAAVTQTMLKLAPLCDLIIGTEEEIRILGGAEDVRAALCAIRAVSSAVLVCKRGDLGCVIFRDAIPDHVDDGMVVPGYAINVLNVLGAGDAFSAGFLSGWLRGMELYDCGRRANACGAMVVSRHGCAPAMPTEVELEQFMNAGQWPVSAQIQRDLDHLNWVRRRRHSYDTLNVLAIDHRIQLEVMAQKSGADPSRIAAFKSLALRAVDAVAAGDGHFGLLLDGRFGSDALMAAASSPYWIGRPIEVSKSRPIEFEGAPDVGVEIASWPAGHVVKCLVAYHPDDTDMLRMMQERQLLRLQNACRNTEHELLLEVVPPTDMPCNSETVGRILARFYEIGMRPDWWKLEPLKNDASWALVQETIAKNDPHCRGVLLLGLNAPEADLIHAFSVAVRYPCVKGFAIGRTVFQDAATRWFEGNCSEAETVTLLSQRFSALIEAWKAALRAEECERCSTKG